jgi:hypothetical protein
MLIRIDMAYSVAGSVMLTHARSCAAPHSQGLGLIKYWKGTHLIHADQKLVSEHAAKYASARILEVDPACLHWQPLPSAPRKRQ